LNNSPVKVSIGYAPWMVTLVVAAFAGANGFYLKHKLDQSKSETVEVRKLFDGASADLQSLREQAAEGDHRATTMRAELSRTKEEHLALKMKMEAQQQAADELAAQLEDIITSDQGELVRQDGGKLSLKLMDKVLFRSGEAQLTDSGMEVLRAVGEALNNYPDKQVWVQGHTDDVPLSKITRTVFASNWELSATRALNVVHFLQDQVMLDPSRLAAVAFGEYRPVSLRKKARNRRIEIVLAPKQVPVVKE
jgi:chemotaxis protein MotB